LSNTPEKVEKKAAIATVGFADHATTLARSWNRRDDVSQLNEARASARDNSR
jgi:hypothetical protein